MIIQISACGGSISDSWKKKQNSTIQDAVNYFFLQKEKAWQCHCCLVWCWNCLLKALLCFVCPWLYSHCDNFFFHALFPNFPSDDKWLVFDRNTIVALTCLTRCSLSSYKWFWHYLTRILQSDISIFSLSVWCLDLLWILSSLAES